MPPPVTSVTETDSTLNLPLNEEYVVVEEQPRGRLGSKDVSVVADEGCWCCADFFGCEDGRFYCSKFSISVRNLCCCFMNAAVVGVGAVTITTPVVKVQVPSEIVKERFSNLKDNAIDFAYEMKDNLSKVMPPMAGGITDTAAAT